MATALIQPLTKGFHEIATHPWTQKVADSFTFGQSCAVVFYMKPNLPSHHTTVVTALAFINLTSHLSSVVLGGKYRDIVELGGVAWFGLTCVPDRSYDVIENIKNITPRAIVITELVITTIQLFKEPRQAILKFSSTAMAFVMHRQSNDLKKLFHYTIFVPMSVINIYNSSGLICYLHIRNLVSRTLGFHPQARSFLYNKVIPKDLHRVAGLIGI